MVYIWCTWDARGDEIGTPACTYTDGGLVSIRHAPGDDEFPALAEERKHKAGKYGTCVSGKSERKQADDRPIGSHMAGRKPVCQGTGEDRKRDEMRQGMDECAVTEPARYAEKRAALKKIIATAEDPAEAYEAARKLQSIPRNANPIRLHNRCKITGRPKGYMRQFGLSRIQFREMASSGLIPGVKKASW